MIDCEDHLCGYGKCNSLGLCTCDEGFDPSTNCTDCSENYFNYPSCVCMLLT